MVRVLVRVAALSSIALLAACANMPMGPGAEMSLNDNARSYADAIMAGMERARAEQQLRSLVSKTDQHGG